MAPGISRGESGHWGFLLGARTSRFVPFFLGKLPVNIEKSPWPLVVLEAFFLGEFWEANTIRFRMLASRTVVAYPFRALGSQDCFI